MTNQIAMIGLSTRMSSAPTIQPMNAPTIGISAVTEIKTEISSAYGMRNSDIEIKKREPRMTASTH